jgi:hypothetical protein
MSDDQVTVRIHLRGALLPLATLGLGFLAAVLLALLSGRAAGAATLGDLTGTLTQAASPVTTPLTETVAPVTATLGDTANGLGAGVANAGSGLLDQGIPVLGTVAPVSNPVLGTASSTISSLAGVTGSVLPVPSSTIPALPVPSLPAQAPAPLGGVGLQGPRTIGSASSGPPSVRFLGLVDRTGSADVRNFVTDPAVTPLLGQRPVVPSPRPRLPWLPLAAMGASPSSGAHGGALDSLPPTGVVLAVLVALGMGLERRRRLKPRFDLRFSPPG